MRAIDQAVNREYQNDDAGEVVAPIGPRGDLLVNEKFPSMSVSQAEKFLQWLQYWYGEERP